MKKFIGISFTIKGQPFSTIKPVLEQISAALGGQKGNVILVHGFMPKSVVMEKGFSTEVVDALREFFPNQINCYSDKPERQQMVDILSSTVGTVFSIGEIRDGVEEEMHMYRAAGIQGRYISIATPGEINLRALTFGERAVGLTFNHGEGEIFDQVNTAKQLCARAIDQMDILRGIAGPGEYAALCTIAYRKLQSAQMDMVKAITWKD